MVLNMMRRRLATLLGKVFDQDVADRVATFVHDLDDWSDGVANRRVVRR